MSQSNVQLRQVTHYSSDNEVFMRVLEECKFGRIELYQTLQRLGLEDYSQDPLSRASMMQFKFKEIVQNDRDNMKRGKLYMITDTGTWPLLTDINYDIFAEKLKKANLGLHKYQSDRVINGHSSQR